MSENPARIEVLLPVALDRAFTYAIPAGLSVAPGDLVRVPLGGRDAIGVAWDGAPSDVPAGRLKPVLERLDRPPLPAQSRQFVDWVARYTLSPLGLVLRMAMKGVRPPPAEKPLVLYRPSGAAPSRMTPARAKVMAVLADGIARTKPVLAQEAGVSPGVIDGLVDDHALIAHERAPEPVASRLDPDHAPPHLSGGQAEAAEALREAVAARAFSTHLLEGVTGAGKTEVYLEAVAEALRAGRQALVMLPEIALTRAVIDRLALRFGAYPVEWHSTVGEKRKARALEAVSSGEAKVVVGARSALFLPFADLGLIVVDEEHDGAFKQEDPPIYNARDMAVVRGRIAAAPVVLVSATPSLETRVNAEAGRYRRHLLPERFGGRTMPEITILDLLQDKPPKGRFIAPGLEAAVRDTLERGEQALLFLNRRGFAPLTLCRTCGHRLGCPQCSAWLVEHRFRGVLQCHHCGHTEPVPHACPRCEAVGSLAPVGPGVERVSDEARTVFPQARLSVLSSDLTVGAERVRAEFEAITEHRVDLIVGTQLVTKGHNFPGLTLVGVVDADLGLGTADPRAAERTFQLIEQVTGRAGRGARPGRGIVQTHEANHPVMRALASGDREGFYRAEEETRMAAGLPPFGRLAAILVSGPDRPSAETYARLLARAFTAPEGVRLLGPAEAPIAVLRGRHRQRLILKSPRGIDLSGLVRDWLTAAPPPKGGVMVSVDMDPVSFL